MGTWGKQEGDEILAGDVVCEVETDKAVRCMPLYRNSHRVYSFRTVFAQCEQVKIATTGSKTHTRAARSPYFVSSIGSLSRLTYVRAEHVRRFNVFSLYLYTCQAPKLGSSSFLFPPLVSSLFTNTATLIN